MAINKKLIHFENFSNFNSKKLSANKENTAYTVGVDGTVTTGTPEILYQSICWIKDTKQQWTHGQLYDCSGNESIGSTTALSGKINLTSIDEIKAAQSALSQTNEVAFYLVTDSSGKIPSSQGCYDIPSANVKQLSLTSPNSVTNGILSLATSSVNINAVGVNVGDLVALTRVKVKVSDLTESIGVNISLSGEIEIYQYKILSMNDAKPTGHREASAGVMGLMSPWDKGQVNKISGIESTANNALPKNDLLPSRWEVNMNNALQTGVYPWCDLGRPAGSTGHYTCIVNRTSTDDGAYNTIEQTAYGREAELGQVYKRIIFEKTDGTDTQFGEWVKVSNDNNAEYNFHCSIVKSENYVQIENPSLGFGVSEMWVDATDSPYVVLSFSTGSAILVMDIDYTYGIDVESSTIAEKVPTKSQVYATKQEIIDVVSTKQDKLVNGVNIKTINGQSLLGSGILTISGNSAYPQINHGTSNTTCMLQPNLFYVWDTVTELNLAFDEGVANEANEYLFQFTSGETATTLFVPVSVKWASEPYIEPNKIYQISILNNLGSILEFEA